MENPGIKTKVVHSKTKQAWNVVSVNSGDKFKVARIPYMFVSISEQISTENKDEALLHAEFISECFNNSDKIVKLLSSK